MSEFIDRTRVTAATRMLNSAWKSQDRETAHLFHGAGFRRYMVNPQFHLDPQSVLEDSAKAGVLVTRVEEALGTIKGRPRVALELRFGWYAEPELDRREVGNLFKVTEDRVRQLENHGLRLLAFHIHPSFLG